MEPIDELAPEARRSATLLDFGGHGSCLHPGELGAFDLKRARGGLQATNRFHNFWVLHSKVEDYSAISHVR